jgi:hypothetical protein
MAEWRDGGMAERQNGTIPNQWWNGGMAEWQNGRMGPYQIYLIYLQYMLTTTTLTPFNLL